VAYDKYVNQADTMFHSIVKGVNDVLPGGGGVRTNAGQGALSQPVNGGQSLAPIASLLSGGLLPTGVLPGVGYVGSDPKVTGKSGGAAAAKGVKRGAATVAPKGAKQVKVTRRRRRVFTV
jgi:hypothetical protein